MEKNSTKFGVVAAMPLSMAQFYVNIAYNQAIEKCAEVANKYADEHIKLYKESGGSIEDGKADAGETISQEIFKLKK
jgi:histidinol dehydrogenase